MLMMTYYAACASSRIETHVLKCKADVIVAFTCVAWMHREALWCVVQAAALIFYRPER